MSTEVWGQRYTTYITTTKYRQFKHFFTTLRNCWNGWGEVPTLHIILPGFYCKSDLPHNINIENIAHSCNFIKGKKSPQIVPLAKQYDVILHSLHSSPAPSYLSILPRFSWFAAGFSINTFCIRAKVIHVTYRRQYILVGWRF